MCHRSGPLERSKDFSRFQFESPSNLRTIFFRLRFVGRLVLFPGNAVVLWRTRGAMMNDRSLSLDVRYFVTSIGSSSVKAAGSAVVVGFGGWSLNKNPFETKRNSRQTHPTASAKSSSLSDSGRSLARRNRSIDRSTKINGRIFTWIRCCSHFRLKNDGEGQSIDR